MKITRTDVVFSRTACIVFLCAGIWIFRCLRKFQEKSEKIHVPEGTLGQRGARGALGALLVRPPPWSRREAAWGGPTPSGALPGPLFLPVTEKCQNISLFSYLCCGAASNFCSSPGELIRSMFWPTVRENHRHHHHHRPFIIPP